MNRPDANWCEGLDAEYEDSRDPIPRNGVGHLSFRRELGEGPGAGATMTEVTSRPFCAAVILALHIWPIEMAATSPTT